MSSFIDVFDGNHAYLAVCAFVAHLAGPKAMRSSDVIDHPAHIHVRVPTLGTRIGFKWSSRKFFAERRAIDKVVGLQQSPALMTAIRIYGELSSIDLEAFIGDAESYFDAMGMMKNSIVVHASYYNEYYTEWRHQYTLPSRSLDSVYVRKEVKATLVDGLDMFRNSEAEYVANGMPYKYVALLHGPPGTGKSSLALAALGAAGFTHVYIMSIGRTMTDAMFIDLVHTMRPRSALLMEDADTLAVNRTEQQGMSFSTMLNVLDGPLRPHGLVCILTTNHIDRFDEAMLRTGRMNDVIFVDKLDATVAADLAANQLKLHKKAMFTAEERAACASKLVNVTTNPSALASYLFASRGQGIGCTELVSGLKASIATRKKSTGNQK